MLKLAPAGMPVVHNCQEDLHKLADDCSYGELKPDLIRDRIVVNRGVQLTDDVSEDVEDEVTDPDPSEAGKPVAESDEQEDCTVDQEKGKDCIGCAKTGSGKTAAFALPILQKLSEDPYGIFALVLTPTRELAFQIADQFKVLGKSMGVRVTVITGGMDMMRQGQDLAVKPHVVISTPGRLADHIESCDTFSLARIKFLVMDEADRLLEDNFGSQLEAVLGKLPAKRQTLLFSATVSPTLRDLQHSVLSQPFVWTQESERATVEELKEEYILLPADLKDAYLIHVLDTWTKEHPRSSIIIFAATCKYAQILGMICDELGFPCAVLHSMIPQRFRLNSLTRFKSNQTRILIATDVASRGLDIPTVDLIINHNVPNRPRDYVHRRLDEQDFGQTKEINKKKRRILEGQDPDEEEEGRKKKKSSGKTTAQVRKEKEERKEKFKAKFAKAKRQKKNSFDC
nr:hypothetical protein BaRGS_002067 [Batillaria attramentaria]